MMYYFSYINVLYMFEYLVINKNLIVDTLMEVVWTTVLHLT